RVKLLKPRAEIFVQTEQWSLAIGVYSEILRLYPGSVDILSDRVKAYRQLGDWSKALADLTEIVEVLAKNTPPDNPNAIQYLNHWRNELAWSLVASPSPDQRDPRRAISLIQPAIEATPENPSYHQTLGLAQYRAGDWKAAVAALEKTSAERRMGQHLLVMAMA